MYIMDLVTAGLKILSIVILAKGFQLRNISLKPFERRTKLWDGFQ